MLRRNVRPRNPALSPGYPPNCLVLTLLGFIEHETSYPLPSDDLLRLYSLGTLVHKVQRVDPENAQKYKLRKSYRRFTQHLPGKDDVEITKTDLNEYMHTAFETKGNEKWEGKDWSRTRLYYLNAVPEQDWRATFASSEKAIPRISSSESGAGAGDWSAFKAKLGKGMKSWAPGPLEDVSTIFLH